jgi:hypothetical protein
LSGKRIRITIREEFDNDEVGGSEEDTNSVSGAHLSNGMVFEVMTRDC